jgi:hypothetical protein
MGLKCNLSKYLELIKSVQMKEPAFERRKVNRKIKYKT